MTDPNTIRDHVRAHYGAVARDEVNGCAPGCCGPTAGIAKQLGYNEGELAADPGGTQLGLGCGNPQAIASLRSGERVLDLGSGAGFDCFVAAQQVGSTGHVIGVDMTADMVSRARAANTLDYVEFRLGEIEQLPVETETVDVILSNCVINLSPDKPRVFKEAFRVLAKGGRLAISDMVAIGPMPEALRDKPEAFTACVTGAIPIEEITQALTDAGFVDIEIDVKAESAAIIAEWMPGTGIEHAVASATIQARKGDCCPPSCCQ